MSFQQPTVIRRTPRPAWASSVLLAGTLAVIALSLPGCSSEDVEPADTTADVETEFSTEDLLAEADKETLDIEKTDLKFGFIKLTDCAPLVIAKEKGYFADEGLNVEIEAQSNWKVLLDRVIDGQLDGAHMLAGQPIAATVGLGTTADIITGYSLDYNGNGITVSNEIWKQMQEIDPDLALEQPKHPITADALKPIVEKTRAEGKDFPMGMVFPFSTHNYEIRYWLAASGINPGMYSEQVSDGTIDADVLLSVTPPPNMPSTLEAGTIFGYCVGEPWNQKAVVDGIGVPVTTNYDIWKNNPEKVFGVTKSWDEKHPNTHIAVVKALMRAGMWLDAVDDAGEYLNRKEACQILSNQVYVGADQEVIERSMTGTFVFQKTDVREMPDFNVFFKYNASYPHYSDCIWFLTQMRRWGQIPEAKDKDWYLETAKQIYRPDVYRQAAEMLIDEGKLSAADIPKADYDGFRPATDEFIDGTTYDGKDPLGYLASFEIGNKN